MKRFTRFVAVSTISAVLLSGAAFAQDHDHHDDHYDYHHYVHHPEWHRGYRMRHEDWDHGYRVDDWRAHHLRRPPRGYEWREVDGNYVLAAVATGIIASVIADAAAH